MRKKTNGLGFMVYSLEDGMNQKILGEKKRSIFDENLADKVNAIYDKIPDIVVSKDIVPGSVELNNLVFEATKDNSLLYFDNSLNALKSRGFTRHARPRELFSVLINDIESPGGNYSSISSNIHNPSCNHPEWVSLAVRKIGNTLECALDPENLVWDKQNSAYAVQGKNLKHYGEIKSFKLGTNLIDVIGRFVSLFYFKDDFVEFLYGRKVNDLPLVMRKNGHATIFLSPSVEGKWWPVGYANNYGLIADYAVKSSRGMREK